MRLVPIASRLTSLSHLSHARVLSSAPVVEPLGVRRERLRLGGFSLASSIRRCCSSIRRVDAKAVFVFEKRGRDFGFCSR